MRQILIMPILYLCASLCGFFFLKEFSRIQPTYNDVHHKVPRQ